MAAAISQPDAPGSSASGGQSSGARAQTPQRASASPEPPEATLYPSFWLGIENSMDLTEPYLPMGREDRKGDIRLNCEDGCAVKSRISVMTRLPAKQRGSYASCRAALGRSSGHNVPLGGVSKGSGICVKHPSGDIALLVVEVKSTALPHLAFMTGQIKIWRADQG